METVRIENEFPENCSVKRGVELKWRFSQNLETGIEGVKSPKNRGGVNILNFQGPLRFAPVEILQKPVKLTGSKVQGFEGKLSGRVSPPPLAFSTF